MCCRLQRCDKPRDCALVFCRRIDRSVRSRCSLIHKCARRQVRNVKRAPVQKSLCHIIGGFDGSCAMIVSREARHTEFRITLARELASVLENVAFNDFILIYNQMCPRYWRWCREVKEQMRREATAEQCEEHKRLLEKQKGRGAKLRWWWPFGWLWRRSKGSAADQLALECLEAQLPDETIMVGRCRTLRWQCMQRFDHETDANLFQILKKQLDKCVHFKGTGAAIAPPVAVSPMCYHDVCAQVRVHEKAPDRPRRWRRLVDCPIFAVSLDSSPRQCPS